MKNREFYFDQLVSLKDKPVVKVITGLRRCGKSTLLNQFKRHLVDSGILGCNIIYMDLESFQYDDTNSCKLLSDFIIENMVENDEKLNILLDEVHMSSLWEKTLGSLCSHPNLDIYLSSSTALMSSGLSAILDGRYVEINMQPLSFKEYVDFNGGKRKSHIDDLFRSYLDFGGLPSIMRLKERRKTLPTILTGIYSTIMLRDIIHRNSIKDAYMPERVLKFIVSNIGNHFSTKSIKAYLTGLGRKVSVDTIDSYLKMLEDAFIIYKVDGIEINGSSQVLTFKKYYIADTGIRILLVGIKEADYPNLIENAVFLELLRRGYSVATGKVGEFELHFIASKPDEKIYFQLSADNDRLEDSMNALKAVVGSDRKVILTAKRTKSKVIDGIIVINIIDFLLQP